MRAAGYSGTPLAKKLGYQPGLSVYVAGAPPHYDAMLAPLPDAVLFRKAPGTSLGLAHVFVRERKKLEAALPRLIKAIRPDGAIWVSWPKKSSGEKTDITEDTIRAVALPMGLVDVKVCAVDDVWSALRLVIRKTNR